MATYSVLPNQEWFTANKVYKAGELVELPAVEAAAFIGTVLSEATSQDVTTNRQRVREQWVKEDEARETERNAILSKWAEEDAKIKADRTESQNEPLETTPVAAQTARVPRKG